MRPHLLHTVLFFSLLLLSAGSVLAQSPSQELPADGVDKVIQFPTSLLAKLSKKQSDINDKLERQTVNYLAKLSRRERKLQRKLAKVDSTKAKELFNGSQAKYAALSRQLQEASTTGTGNLSGTYMPYLDSVKTSLQFLNKHPQVLAAATSLKNGDGKASESLPSLAGKARDLNLPAGVEDKLQASLGQVNQLQNRLQQSQAIKAYIAQRKQQIKTALSQYTHLPAGITKSYGALTRDMYYYQAQVQAYKNMLNDPDKLEQKALELLNKLPAFQSFMQQNSMLAGLFRVPANYGSPAALAGLQTRDQVQQLISNRIASGGPNAMNQVQQNLQAAQSQLSQLKDKVNQLGGSSSDLAMPDFKPNSQKTKSFLDRIELGSNLQTTKSNSFFPTTSDIGLSAAYKLSDKSSIGLGGSYKLGLGKDIRHVAFSSEGIGLRSFVDLKLKGSFWATGGMELNYRNRFDNFQVLQDRSAWQQSALIGLSKKYQVSKKVKGNAQLLYDALWHRQVPRGQPVVFGLGII